MSGNEHLANSLLRGDLTAVDAAARAEIAKSKTNSAAYYYMSCCHLLKGELDQAIDAAEQALCVSPVYPDAFLLRAETALFKQDEVTARKMCLTISELPAASYPALLLASKVLAGDAALLKVLARLSDKPSGKFRFLMEQSRSSLANADATAALKTITEALELKPTNAEALQLRAACARALKDAPLLHSSVMALVQVAPDKALSFIKVFISRGDLGTGVDVVKSVAAANPNSAALPDAGALLSAALNEKARAAAANGDMASEFTALAQKAALEGGMSSPTQSLENKAARCFKQAKDFYDVGHFDQADALLKPLLQYVPGPVRLARLAALVSEQRLDWGAAHALWRSVSEHADVDPEAKAQAVRRSAAAADKAGDAAGSIEMYKRLALAGDERGQTQLERVSRELCRELAPRLEQGEVLGVASQVKLLSMLDSDQARRLAQRWTRQALVAMKSHNLAHEDDECISLGMLAAQISPENHAVARTLASSLVRKRKYDLALPLLQELVKAEPHQIKHFNRLGRVLMGLGYTDEAKATYLQALKLDPNNEAAKTGFRRLN